MPRRVLRVNFDGATLPSQQWVGSELGCTVSSGRMPEQSSGSWTYPALVTAFPFTICLSPLTRKYIVLIFEDLSTSRSGQDPVERHIGNRVLTGNILFNSWLFFVRKATSRWTPVADLSLLYSLSRWRLYPNSYFPSGKT